MKTTMLTVLGLLWAAVAVAQVQPNGIPAPAGYQWAVRYDEEFTQETSLNPIWTSFNGAITLDSVNGLSLQGSPTVVNGGMATGDAITQRYGVWEWLAKFPHNDNGEAAGYHTDLYLADSWAQFPFYIEDDVCEWDTAFSGATSCASGINDTEIGNISTGQLLTTFSTKMPNNGSGSPPIGDAFHTYDMVWANDGTPHGTVSNYFDRVQQTNTIWTLTNARWDQGARPLIINRDCGQGKCSSSGSNPLFIKYFRVWQLVPIGTSVPTASPAPTATATPSPNCSEVTTVGPTLNDGTGGAWSFDPSFHVLRNGAVFGGSGAGLTDLIFAASNIYVFYPPTSTWYASVPAGAAWNNGSPVGPACPGVTPTPIPTPTPVPPTPTPVPPVCSVTLSVPPSAASPVAFAPVVTGCPGWPSATGFVRVEQTAPFPTHFDGNAGTTSTTVALAPGSYTAYVTIWSNTVTQVGGASNSVSFTVSGATPTPQPPTPTPLPPTPTPTPTIAPTSTPTPGASVTPSCPPGYTLECPNCVLTPPTPTPVASPTPAPLVMRANDFLNIFGYTTHHGQGKITAAQIEQGLTYTGVRHYRDDGTVNPSLLSDYCAIHAATGATMIMLPFGGDLTDTMGFLDTLAKCNALMAVEGQNEANNQPFQYGSTTCDPDGHLGSNTSYGCGAFQRDFYAAEKADSNLSALPMLAPTEMGDQNPDNAGLQFLSIQPGSTAEFPVGTVYADVANIHPYDNCATNPPRDNDAWSMAAPVASDQGCYDGMNGEFEYQTWRNHFPAYPGVAIPYLATESGQATAPENASGISYDIQGKVYTDLALDAALRGAQHWLVYQMGEEGDGLGAVYTASFTYKLGATYMHNLTTILADTSSNFTPVAVPITITTPQPSTVHYLLMQKSSGTHEFAIWGEAFTSGQQAVATITFNSATSGSVYDITTGTSPVSTFNGTTVTLTLSDHAMIVEFNNASQPLAFQPQCGSPVCGAGIAVAGLNTDFYGQMRPNPPSMGAVECPTNCPAATPTP